MRWGKIVLLFQAIITLLIGLVFLMQMFDLEKVDLDKLVNESLASADQDFENISELPAVQEYISLRAKFQRASYILIIVSLIEWILITRLLNEPIKEGEDSESGLKGDR